MSLTVSHRLSIAFPPEPHSETTSTLVLSTPDKHFLDLRILLPLPSDPSSPLPVEQLQWSFFGTSSHDQATNLTTWVHALDSHYKPGEYLDRGVCEPQSDGTVLEKGVDMGGKKYEELWREGAIERGRYLVLVGRVEEEGAETDCGAALVRVGEWYQAMVKKNGRTSAGRWRHKGEGTWERVAVVGGGLETPEISWWKVGGERAVGDVVWRCVECGNIGEDPGAGDEAEET